MSKAATGPRRASEPELVGAAQVAARLGVFSANLKKIPDLPEPYQTTPRRLWRATDIEAFAPQWHARRRKQTHP